MRKYDKMAIGRQAAELDYTRDAFEKVCRLTEFLRYFENHPLLSECLALKGGTAINLTVFALPRLSVDIDLDFSGDASLDEMKNGREKVTTALQQYLAAEDYHIGAKSKTHHSLDSFVCSYKNAAGNNDNLKVEINYSLRSHVLPLVRRPIETLGAFTPTNVLTLDAVELFAAKIAALIARTAPRDLYDVDGMVCRSLFDDSQLEMLRKCVIFYAAVSGDVSSGILGLDRLASITDYRVRTELLPVIRKKERFDLSAAQKRVHDFLAPLLALTDDEKEFLSAFTGGHYRPELLFSGDALGRVREHPMALWKTRERGDEELVMEQIRAARREARARRPGEPIPKRRDEPKQ
jgi:predicted nucleotidyltransferase component of viral defense system